MQRGSCPRLVLGLKIAQSWVGCRDAHRGRGRLVAHDINSCRPGAFQHPPPSRPHPSRRQRVSRHPAAQEEKSRSIPHVPARGSGCISPSSAGAGAAVARPTAASGMTPARCIARSRPTESAPSAKAARCTSSQRRSAGGSSRAPAARAAAQRASIARHFCAPPAPPVSVRAAWRARSARGSLCAAHQEGLGLTAMV
jgi:hypothetical protein